MAEFTHKDEISECGTGLIFKSYYDGEPCENIKITGPRAKRYSALQLEL